MATRSAHRIPYGKHYLDEDDIRAVVEVLRSAPLTQGPKIAEFEQAVAAYVGARYAVAVSSGTAALHLAALAAGLGPGDALVTTPNTFVASANAGLYAGSKVLLADIDPETLNIDPTEVARLCSKENRVKVIVPVHFAGYPCEMPQLRKIANDAGARIIEDACHALGASYPQGGRVGNCAYADMTVFSFHPVKAIAAGEGGMIVTSDPELHEKLLELRTHGITKNPGKLIDRPEAFTGDAPNPWYYEMQALGYNYRLTDIQCALALSQLKKLDRFIERRRQIARRYDAALARHPLIVLRQTAGRERSAHHLYVVEIDFSKARITRQELMTKMSAAGIACQVHYIPVHFQPYYQRQGFHKGQFPAAEAYYRKAISLPIYYSLTDEEQDFVIETLLRFLK